MIRNYNQRNFHEISPQAIAAEITATGRRAAGIGCDVSKQAAVTAAVAAAERDVGPIDLLVNNAGITKRIPLFEWTEPDWEEVIRINQVGTFLMEVTFP